MVDAWTQTSNKESDADEEETKEVLKGSDPSLPTKSTGHSFYSSKPSDSPVSLYKRNNPSKYKINMNANINNKTFRSPISNSISNYYKKKEYNTSFSLSKSKGRLFNKDNLDIKKHRHSSSHYNSLGERFTYAQRQVRKSPKKAYHPGSHESSSKVL